MAEIDLELPYGDDHLPLAVSSQRLLGVILPAEGIDDHGDEQILIREALRHPIGTPPLCKLVQAGQRVAIVISDMTRPCPSTRLLPRILDELADGGIADAEVTVVVALGLHRAQTEDELAELVGPAVYERVRVINHDPDDVVRLGVTSHGTPVELFRPLLEADVRVCLGNLEFHYFAGYSGGAKSILPGCASKVTVTANHGLMTRPGAITGRLEGNPVREDLEDEGLGHGPEEDAPQAHGGPRRGPPFRQGGAGGGSRGLALARLILCSTHRVGVTFSLSIFSKRNT